MAAPAEMQMPRGMGEKMRVGNELGGRSVVISHRDRGLVVTLAREIAPQRNSAPKEIAPPKK